MNIGVHVFAGGFTMGVQRVLKVEHQLEVHGLGTETASTMTNVITSQAKDWPKLDVQFVYGNPRCTAFSCLSCGSTKAHGAWAAPTRDIRELSEYAVSNGAEIVIWESVQQATTVGRPLLEHLMQEVYKGYRFAHIFTSGHTFGNSQSRYRYFFVAYRGKNFNIIPPDRKVVLTCSDALKHLEKIECNPFDKEWTADTYDALSEEERKVVPHMLPGECLNSFARNRLATFRIITPKLARIWDNRMSGIPFSVHCLRKLEADGYCPTLSSSSSRTIHYKFHRPITVREVATLMGWDRLPIGKHPWSQIAKGIIPDIGEWIAKQVKLFFEDHWNDEDFSSKYDISKQEWVGEFHSDKPLEKTFNLEDYACFHSQT